MLEGCWDRDQGSPNLAEVTSANLGQPQPTSANFPSTNPVEPPRPTSANLSRPRSSRPRGCQNVVSVLNEPEIPANASVFCCVRWCRASLMPLNTPRFFYPAGSSRLLKWEHINVLRRLDRPDSRIPCTFGRPLFASFDAPVAPNCRVIIGCLLLPSVLVLQSIGCPNQNSVGIPQNAFKNSETSKEHQKIS
jgi:hypothetical protein